MVAGDGRDAFEPKKRGEAGLDAFFIDQIENPAFERG
jgi:hypothetical protein